MSFTSTVIDDHIATLTLQRGKVNPLNEALVAELQGTVKELAADPQVQAVILTGAGKFFSFGFDIPEFLPYPKERFGAFMENFSNLCLELFLFPKPLVAALNGHTVAGGCMLATACDVRLMVSGKAKMALNEITFGSSMPSHTLELLRYWVGSRRAETILLSGALYDPEEAQALGLVDKVVAPEDLPATARHVAREMAQKDPAAFRSLKRLLRQPTLNAIAAAAPDSLRDFLDLWYSESTRQQLQEIKIHS